ncbi:MAG: hypothetical protein ABR598_01165 [Candidatus Dormibacteria bacterium]
MSIQGQGSSRLARRVILVLAALVVLAAAGTYAGSLLTPRGATTAHRVAIATTSESGATTHAGGAQYAQQVLGASTTAGQAAPTITHSPEAPRNPIDPRLLIAGAWLCINVLVVVGRRGHNTADAEDSRPVSLATWRYNS